MYSAIPWEGDMRGLLVMIGLAGVIAVFAAPSAQAADLGKIVHAITDRHEAQRYEERAHRNKRPDEERYWHRYGQGLQQHDRDHR
jgi:hypothetical protein